MSYRRRAYRNGSRRQDTFLRTLRYEAPKEGLGKLLEKLGEWGGALAGLAAATALSQKGLPVPGYVLTGSGVVLGAVAGVFAKAAVNATVDTLKGFRGERRLARSTMAEVVAQIEQVVGQFERTSSYVGLLAESVHNWQGHLLLALRGSQTVLHQVAVQTGGARTALEEAHTQLRLARDSLRTYLRIVAP